MEAENAALRRALALADGKTAAAVDRQEAAILREREEQLRLIFESAADYAIIGMGSDRRITSWNAGAERLLGWTEAEIVGGAADVIFTPEDRDAGAPEREAEGALRDGRAVNERWHVRKDGSRFWGSGLAMPLRDTAGGPDAPPLGLLKIMRDRTAERRTEEALREAEDHLRHTVELNPQIPWTADPAGRITGFSNRWLEATGLTRVEALGEGWTRVPHPDDLPGMAEAWGRSVATGEPYDVEARLRMADGAHRWWRVRASPRRGDGGRVVRWYGTTENIHDRKQAEAALREGEARWRGLFESMQEGFVLGELVRDASGRAIDWRYLDVNPAWGRMTGVPPERVAGRTVREAFPGIEGAWIDGMVEVVETGVPATFTREVGLLGRWYEGHVFHAGGDRFGAISLEVTDRVAAEARRDALVELGDRLRDLRDPGGIAHAAAAVIGRTLGAARAGYGTLDPDEDGIRIERDWTGNPDVASIAGSHRLSDYWAGGFVGDLRRGGVVAIDDVARDPRTALHAARLGAFGIRSCVHAAVVEAGRLAAVLFVHAPEARAWTAEEVAFVRGAAERAWAAAERTLADAALRDSEGRRRAALAAARLGTWEWDTESGTAVLDGRGREIFGLAPEWGDRAEIVFDRIHPDDRQRIRDKAVAAAAVRGRLDTEYRVTLPDGSERAVASFGDALPDTGDEPVRMVGVFADVTERRRAEERRALLVNELNHRVKNTLAVVQSLALQTARGAVDLPSFSAAFHARLGALARAHDLLTRTDWAGAPLVEVARTALESSGNRVSLSACGSPDAPLAPAQALALVMALHELATNALKHGALSAPGGRVSVAYRTEPGPGSWDVDWAERGGPPVPVAPARRGFGLRLLERGLASQAGLRADFRFETEGVRCVLRLPPSSGHAAEKTSEAPAPPD